MKTSDKQWKFLQDAAKLILFIEDQGWKASGGELQRTMYQQREHLRTGRSKTKRSRHLGKMAIDLNLWLDGSLITNKLTQRQRIALRIIGDYWNSLDPLNISGIDWDWDYGHFQRSAG